MSIGISEDHVELAATLRKWASSLGGCDLARAAEGAEDAAFAGVWSAAQEMGITTIGLPEAAGGGGGTVLDVAVAIEACAHELVPGALLGPAVAALLLGPTEHAATLAEGAVVGLALGDIVWDAPQATHVLLATSSDAWVLAPRDAVEIILGAPGIDLTRRFGTARLVDETRAVPVPGLSRERVRRAAVTLGAAEAAGLARWCLATAVDYAKVREQFGRKIGSFQAVKHLCAEMLEHAEALTSVAWDVANAAQSGDDAQWSYASDVAATVAFDAALEVAKSCIQVLGGIGFTFEHDAHFYYRRASALRGLLGSGDAAAVRLASRAVAGERRVVEVDLDGRDEPLRPQARETAERIAALSGPERRAALVDSGYLTPHWPAPYGLGADAVQQLVIDQELTRAGVERPDLVIAGWAVPTILEHGTDAQRERFVPPSLLGELVWCQLFSEPGAGSDLASLRTRAERVDGGWRLTGQKVWTSGAQKADWGICLARTDPDAPQHRGITYFLVDMRRSPGIEIRPLREMTGDALFNEVFLDDVFVPDDCVVAEPGDGWRLARTTLANERVAMASSRLGKSTERAVELAAAGVGEAELVKVGRAVALATVCSLLGVRTVMRSLAGRGPGPESSVAKLLGVRSRQEGSELVVALQADRLVVPDDQLRADLWEMLSTRCLSIAGGTTQILRNVAGERILGLPR
ncbi:acyl-CoA dehydrogenase [Nocardioides sp. dk4132]|uniref:acyl-CoA dehydrogenase n=1 Tax=unclassified Nocardioides TaxID=2615069 RepID=UPI001296A887|nr:MULTISPECIES: acyl-CoA dehydrogenase [unclassified Nocardioides]MQW75016.1 acyl-CoA dehydrogenase [Nocardioides sp. dk4132]QGA07811.1 acyl-CoA dehydrogenase [Nocardioides sp. dk884]